MQKKFSLQGQDPRGFFAALKLLEEGIKPIIFERGKMFATEEGISPNSIRKE
jgi:hypothetical protein